MSWIVKYLWLIPTLPMLAAGIIALTKQRHRSLASTLAIGSMSLSLVLSLIAFAHTLGNTTHQATPEFFNFNWVQFGDQWVKLGWVLDPLTAVMLVMVTFVGLLIFLYSTAYMAEDERFARFFCFLALFAGAMLGVVISNSLLLLFMCWEIMGLTSYLLIGFWYERPSAAAAAKKAFLVTRIGDLGLLLGMAWLYASTNTLLFYDGGAGCVEHTALTALVSHATVWGISLASAISLLIFCGAAGKSGQVPLHVWLPDAMEGPTPVSALIHAATMVAAGVFLMARIYPLASAQVAALPGLSPTLALQVVTWVGAITALFGASVAVAQYDIKRILAYSTVSQLGYMMMGLGTGGVAVGMFHLITHAFFKSLLFLGAGSVIHGCAGEQDIRHMGGLRRFMPVTFATYTAGMLALCGFPLFFSGFWSKDEILHAAFLWNVSRLPFFMGICGAFLTAFYMTRQLCYIFAGNPRKNFIHHHVTHELHEEDIPKHGGTAHESPSIMTLPLAILAACAVLLGFLGTPVWPWFQSFLEGESTAFDFGALVHGSTFSLMLASSLLVFSGLGLGWLLYGRKPVTRGEQQDALSDLQPQFFSALNHALYIEPFYNATIVRATFWFGHVCAWFDRWIWNGFVQILSWFVLAVAWIDHFIDTYIVNGGFDFGCWSAEQGGQIFSQLQTGRVQSYLRMIGLAFVLAVILLFWRAQS